MKIWEGEQGSDFWFEARKGKVTASNFDKIITPARGELSTQWEDYAAELVGDVLSLIPPENVESFTSRAVRWGQMVEAEARAWYSFQIGLEVIQVGGIMTDDERFWTSPDGLVGATGGLELKAPQSKTHVLYCNNPDRLLKAYRCQVHGALWITGRAWWDLVSYSPGLPGLRLRVEPDAFTEKLGAALLEFYPKYAALLERLRGAA